MWIISDICNQNYCVWHKREKKKRKDHRPKNHIFLEAAIMYTFSTTIRQKTTFSTTIGIACTQELHKFNNFSICDNMVKILILGIKMND